jgi:uncharacterized protein with ParB-like and HNH nuclease domain/predicted transport protein
MLGGWSNLDPQQKAAPIKAKETKLLAFMQSARQFLIPIFQRPYSWEEGECKQLWGDILRAGSTTEISAHFVGSIVYIEQGLYQVSAQSPLFVIDGQQRLTTVSLLIEALARHLGDEEPVDGFSAKKLRNYYLLNPEEDGEKAFKLILSSTDKDTLLAVTGHRPWPVDSSDRIQKNFEFFQTRLKELGDELTDLCNGLTKLIVVDISLTRGEDNPQLIFESMNSTGRELSQADLIRNFVLMDLEPEQQTGVYRDHWRPMEIEFGQEAYGKYFDSFMRHYLTLKTGEIPNIRDVYEAFKRFRQSPEVVGLSIEELVGDVATYASYYCAMALGTEQDPELRAAFTDLRDLKVDVAYPFLLELYADYRAGLLTKENLISLVRLVESYVFRRSVCAIPTNSLNKTFATIGRAINKAHYVESAQVLFLSLPSYKRFPANEEFIRDLKTRDLYNSRNRSYLLRHLENHDRKELVPFGQYTIEHIMPQNANLSAQWKASLGEEWRRVHETHLHTLGNLTLTGYNSEYSDRPFAEKRDMEGGFAQSPLHLNRGLGDIDDWNEAAIDTRADLLAKVAATVWAHPDLPEEILSKYHPEAPPSTTYTIEDHGHLSASGPMRSVFEAFRKEVLALDPEVVTEEFLKLYVAYKAETNFVDVVPQASRLRLALNMDFPEVYDPEGICIDVTNKGRWGNGNVEVHLDSISGIPYVMGLVQQAFEKQMAGDP